MKIKNKMELKKIILEEKKNYFSGSISKKCLLFLKNDERMRIWKYIKLLRYSNYYYHIRKNNLINSLMYVYYVRRLNKYGNKCGIVCGEHVFDKGLIIYHSHGIVINGNAKIGKNCRLYGNNCIGNDGISSGAPIIGDDVKICVGAKIIGNVKIANGVVIAAGAIVVNDILEENAIYGGIPAKKIGVSKKEFLK